MQILKKDHVKPTLTQGQYKKTKIRAMWNDYSEQYLPCGYCGEAHHKMYRCSCGFDETYDDDGNHVWSNE